MRELVTDDEMRGEGWKKALTLKKIEVRNGKCFLLEYDFFAEKVPCRVREHNQGTMCGFKYTWVKQLHGKVFLSCAKHQHVDLLSTSLAYLHSETEISPCEGIRVLRKEHHLVDREIPKRLRVLCEASKIGQEARVRPSDIE